MLGLPIEYTLIRSFPESIIMVFATNILWNLSLSKKEIFKYGIILGLSITLIRSLPIVFGMHTILIMVVYAIMISMLMNKQPVKSMLSTCLIFASLILSEAVYMMISVYILGIEEKLLLGVYNMNSALMSLPSLLVFLLIVILLKKVIDKLNFSRG